jgi:hypothetical protein
VGLDYLAIWALTIANSFAVLLIVRRLAQLPSPRGSGPRIGAPLGSWTLKTLTGDQRSSADMPSEYTMLFTSDRCGQCRTLFGRLAQSGRMVGRLVVASDGDAAALTEASVNREEPLYDELLSGADLSFRQQLRIPGTPFAIAVRGGRVIASGAAATPEDLQKIANALGP